MTTTTNVGDIYSLLNKVSNLLKSDMKTLVDNIDLLEDEYKSLPTNSNDNIKERKAEIIEKIDYFYNTISYFSKLSKEIDNKYLFAARRIDEGEVISYLAVSLNRYGMLDISFSTKGKITIDLKHCNDIEEL